MRAIVLSGGSYQLRDVEKLAPAAGEVLIQVKYAGVNRADLFQKQGKYPLPSGNPAIPGLEVSGIVAACGQGVSMPLGETVCALMSEGAFAEYVCVPEAHILTLPEGISLEQAAALPEACYTAWVSLVWQAQLKQGEIVLIHGGASGVGSIAIQIARLLGARVFATAGSDEKCAACATLGAQAIHYKSQDFVSVIEQATAGHGVDVILDMVGGDYLQKNLRLLAMGGRLCIIAFLKGAKTEANLSPILLKHLSVMGSTLRGRNKAEKKQIAAELQQAIWPHIGSGKAVNPLIAKQFTLEEAEKALSYMEQGLNVGKIVLKI